MQKQISQLVDSLKPYRPEKIILFGSAASGKAKKGSDLDVLIIKNTRQPFWERQKTIAKLLRVNLEVDAFVLTPLEVEKALKDVQPFIWDIIHEGKIIYEQKTG